jgi:formiminotetrahydrofolate cyclodeaminase
MGAGLVAKAARVTLQRQAIDGATQTAFQALFDLADQQQDVLMRLAKADERAYRAVLKTGSRPTSSPAERETWLQATEVPIRIAEVCRSLVDTSAPWLDDCWPAVRPDLQIGLWLLETGNRAGLVAAESNIGFCRDTPAAKSLQLRIAALK